MNILIIYVVSAVFYRYHVFVTGSTVDFRSPEPSAQVRFVRCRRRCRRCRRRCRKLFTFSSSSSEPLGQFQPNLAQSILG